jgi:prepilin-type N-terminal cleavage/methylation domain-containing protein
MTILRPDRSTSSGFTLIELLVVIAIIGLLAAIILVSLGNTRVKARDARRLSDLSEMSKALELYYTSNNAYPNTNAGSATDGAHTDQTGVPGHPGWYTLIALATNNFMPSVPLDPTNVDQGPWPWEGGGVGVNTIYTYASNGQHYVLCAWMEDQSNPYTLQKKDITDSFNTSAQLYANDGYSAYNYCIAK